MAQQFVNGELVDDSQNDQSSPMAGLASTSTPTGKPQGNPWQSVDYSPELIKSSNYGGSWGGIGKDLQGLGDQYQLGQGTWGKAMDAYLQHTGNTSNDQQWWGPEAAKRAYIQGLGYMDPDKYGNAWNDYQNSGKYNQAAETAQQGQSAATGMADQKKNGGSDWFSSFLPMLALGGIGLATGGFGFGLGGLGGAGSAINAGITGDAMAGFFGGGEALGGAGAAAAAGGAGAGELGYGLDNIINSTAGDVAGWAGSQAGDPLSGLFSGMPSGFDPGLAQTFMGNDPAAATNIEQALNSPTPASTSNVPYADGQPMQNIGNIPDQVGPIDPQAPQGLDQAVRGGLDSQGANMRMGGPGLNNLYGSPGSAGSINGLNPGASSFLGNTPVNVSQAAMNPSSFGLNDIFKAFQSPEGTIGRKLFDLYNQNQKVGAYKDLMSKFQSQGDPGAPFRQRLQASYDDPNFFKNMPEYQAGMDNFNQQYGATAAKNGLRSQMGGTAQNIAVNRASAGLADTFRSRLAQMAGQQPNMSGQIGLANSLVSAQGNQFNTLFDPSLWAAISKLSA
jgi:hypothetical protein